jgi:hypothetical protein
MASFQICWRVAALFTAPVVVAAQVTMKSAIRRSAVPRGGRVEKLRGGQLAMLAILLAFSS